MLEATTLRGSSLLMNLAIVDEEPVWDMLPVNLYIFIYLFVCLSIYVFICLLFPDGFVPLLCTVRRLTSFSKTFQKIIQKGKNPFSVIPRVNLTLIFTFDRLVNPPWKLVLIPFFCRLLWYVFELRRTMIIRGDWLWKPTNIKVENNGAVIYVGSSLTVHNPCFFVLKFRINKLIPCFYWSVSSKW